MTSQTYDSATIRFHWTTAFLVVALWLVGQTADWFPRGPARGKGLLADQLRKILSLDKFHGEEMVTIGLAHLVDRHNIRVSQRRGRFRLILESPDKIRAGKRPMQQHL